MSSNSSHSKPKRPLSSYNLFYRYKRTKIIEAGKGNSSACQPSKNDICEIVNAPPGLENYQPALLAIIPKDRLDELRRTNIRKVLEQQLLSKDRRNRLHRKSSHGGFKMGFTEMNKLMIDTWKKADKFTKVVFQELAEQGRKEYQMRLLNVNAESQPSGAKGKTSRSLVDTRRDMMKSQQIQVAPTKAVVSSQSTQSMLDKTQAVAEVERSSSNHHLKVDSSWEPLPFLSNDASHPLASTSIQASSSTASFTSVMGGMARASIQASASTASVSSIMGRAQYSHERENFHYPKLPAMCTSLAGNVSPVLEKQAIPTIVTPAWTPKPSLITMSYSGAKSVIYGNELPTQMAQSSEQFPPGVINPPVYAQARCHSCGESEESMSAASSTGRPLGEQGRSVSADDFMDFIATLSGI